MFAEDAGHKSVWRTAVSELRSQEWFPAHELFNINITKESTTLMLVGDKGEGKPAMEHEHYMSPPTLKLQYSTLTTTVMCNCQLHILYTFITMSMLQAHHSTSTGQKL